MGQELCRPTGAHQPTAISTRAGRRRDHQATSGDGEHAGTSPPGEQVAKDEEARPIA